MNSDSRPADQSDQFVELLDIIAPDGGAVVVLRHVYMDESGTHEGSPALAMAGYVFTKEQAQRFSRDWGRDLARFGLPFGHMTNCATGNDAYANLSLQQRIDSEKALIAHTRHRSLYGVAIAVDYERYKELFGKGRFEYQAYTFCLTLCVVAVHYWAQESGYNGRFAYIFESGHDAQAEANNIMNRIRKSKFGETYFSHTFVDKRDAPPLQAADMLAWQYAHFLKRRAEGHANKRKDFVALLRPRDRLREFAADAVNHWRTLMNELNIEIIKKVQERFPDDPASAAYAASQLFPRE